MGFIHTSWHTYADKQGYYYSTRLPVTEQRYLEQQLEQGSTIPAGLFYQQSRQE